MITLSNGAKIYTYGRPKTFLMAGVHGEERAGVMALYHTLSDKLKDVWIMPCLNIQGHRELNRYCGKKDLNGEFREDTTLDFMQELMDILRNNKPELFVDMHEDINEYNDYIWSHFGNEHSFDIKVRKYCEDNNTGLVYQPNVEWYNDTSESWVRSIGVPNCYTTETMQYAPFNDRLKKNQDYIKFFLSIV